MQCRQVQRSGNSCVVFEAFRTSASATKRMLGTHVNLCFGFASCLFVLSSCTGTVGAETSGADRDDERPSGGVVGFAANGGNGGSC